MKPAPQILCVEDDSDLRAVLAEQLAMAGHVATAVGTGLEFFSKLAQGAFDLALVDLGLPDESGEVLVSYVRRNTPMPVIVLTARDDVDTRVRCYRLGAHLFLGKPVVWEELVAAVGSLLARPRSEPARPSEPPWRLDPVARVLADPAGARITLTGAESALLRLLASPAAIVGHAELQEALYGRGDASAAKALEAQLRRTRRTIADALGRPAPLINHYGVGYAFAGRLVVDGV